LIHRKTISEQLGVDPDPNYLNPAPARPPKTEEEHLGLDTPAHLPETRWPESQAEPEEWTGWGRVR
jgi:hypothetical protein